MVDKQLISKAVYAAMAAGAEILDVYCQQQVEVDYKADKSPVTKADIRAHAAIVKILEPTEIPILSEEGVHLPYAHRKLWKMLWVIDPLDGTNEFVAKSDDFCVNIALVENGAPVMGVLYSPVRDTVWFGAIDIGAYKIERATNAIDDFSFESMISLAISLPYRNTGDEFVFVASRSNLNAETKAYIDKISTQHTQTRIAHVGSALKFTLLAEGLANLYPRFATTSEWDTAAGHAILRAIGGEVFQNESSKPLEYNKECLDNPGFIAVPMV